MSTEIMNIKLDQFGEACSVAIELIKNHDFVTARTELSFAADILLQIAANKKGTEKAKMLKKVKMLYEIAGSIC